MKQAIKLTETDLHKIVNETVSKILKETDSVEEILDDLAWKEASRVCQSDFSDRREDNWNESYELAKKAAMLIYNNPAKYFPNGELPPKIGLNSEVVKKIYNELGLDADSELRFIKSHFRTSNNIEGAFLDVLRYLLFDMEKLGFIK